MDKLPNRRTGITAPVSHIMATGDDSNATGTELKLLVTCNWLVNNQTGEISPIKEVFCANPMKGSDIDALLIDGCILISLLIQSGMAPADIAAKLSERRPERGTSGPPASILGTVAKQVAKMDQELRDGKT